MTPRHAEIRLRIVGGHLVFVSVENCATFHDWHSTDLDSAGQNHIETIKKLYKTLYLYMKKTSFRVFSHYFAQTNSVITVHSL